MAKQIKTQGNFTVCGPDGERIAGFAMEKDKKLFEAARLTRNVLRDLVDSTNMIDCTEDTFICGFCGR